MSGKLSTLALQIIIGCILLARFIEGGLLSRNCQGVTRACVCETEGNSVAIICPNEFSIILELRINTTIHVSYYQIKDFRNVPKLHIDKVAKLDIDAHNFWNHTLLPDLLNAMGIIEVTTLVLRDRVNVKPKVGEWLFGEINNLKTLKFDSDITEINETIFDAYSTLTSLAISLDVQTLPVKLLSSLTNLRILSVQNKHFVNFKGLLAHNIDTLEYVLISIEEKRVKRLDQKLFTNMTKLRYIHLVHATDELTPEMFRNAYNLQELYIIENEHLTELPSTFLEDQKNLKMLDLHSNAIQSLPVDVFSALENLETLDISMNNINELTGDVFQPLKNLKALKLNYNPLTMIDPNTFSKTTSLNFVDMRSTQFYGSRLSVPYEAILCINDDMCHYRAKPWHCPNSCLCWVERTTKELIMDCSNAELKTFPKLPTTTLVSTSLKLGNNSIDTLPIGTDLGYANVSELYLSENQISDLQINQLPMNLTFLDVSKNQIRRFCDEFIAYLSKPDVIVKLKIGGNPLACDCTAQPLLSFVRSQPKRIHDLSEVRCRSRKFTKSFQQLDANDICPSNILLIVAITGGLVVLLCLCVVFYLWYEQPIKIWLYNNNLCLWYVSAEELDKDKLYDAFVSYSHMDEEFVAQLLPKLEGGSHPFKICLHGRDWLVGDCIPDRIVRTVEESKRIIIILSQDFINSVWARMEFRIAYQASLEDKRKRLIIILYKDIENMDGLGSELKAYLKLNTYLKWSDPNFWSKLRYAMPHNKRMLKSRSRWESTVSRISN